MKVEIQVSKNGVAPGTVGWLARELEDCTLGTGTTKLGYPAVFLRRERDGKRESFALALYGDTSGYDAPPQFHYWPDILDRYEPADLFGVSLTPAAKEKLEQLASKADDILREWMDEQDEAPLEFDLSTKED